MDRHKERDADEGSDNDLDALQDELGGLAIAGPRRRLVVLDLNGLLIYRVFKKRCEEVPDFDKHKAIAVSVNEFYVWKRPHLDSFLDFLFDSFDVAVWSSAMQRNVTKLIDYAFGAERRNMLVCELDQGSCPQEKHPDPKAKKPLFLKPLSCVWKAHPQYNESNTLLIDDTPAKAGRNPLNLLYSPAEWTISSGTGANELAVNGAIRLWLQGLRDWNGDVASYVVSRTAKQ